MTMRKRPARRGQGSPGRVLDIGEYGDTGRGSGTARKSLYEALQEIAELERDRAKAWQKRMGIKQPLKTGFYPVDPEVDAALQKIWNAGPNGKDLYVQIGKGLAAIDRKRLFRLAEYEAEKIDELAKAEILNSRLHYDAIGRGDDQSR